MRHLQHLDDDLYIKILLSKVILGASFIAAFYLLLTK